MSYRHLVTNDDGEPLGFEYIYPEEHEPSDFDFEDDDYEPDEELNCPGHPTADETSGDASEKTDGRWVCDIGPCPSESACRHSWTAGMLYVDDEDLETVSAVRAVECEKCETVYVREGA